MLKRIRQSLLNAQLGIRNWFRKRDKQELRNLQEKRTELGRLGKSTREIDLKIDTARRNLINESKSGAATVWLTPVERLARARGLGKKLRK